MPDKMSDYLTLKSFNNSVERFLLRVSIKLKSRKFCCNQLPLKQLSKTYRIFFIKLE